MQIEQRVSEYIDQHPDEYLGNLTYEGQSIWIKRRPLSKKKIWHRLAYFLTYLIPMPVFYPTVVDGEHNTLEDEATRLRNFAAKGIPVPEVLAVTKDYLVTNNVGSTLQHLIESANPQEKNLLMEQALQALIHLHQQGLCHGRPYLRDMTRQDDQVYFLDLEENPLAVMNLGQAQARDIWLYFNNVARFSQQDATLIILLYQIYAKTASPATLTYLKQMVRFIKPVRYFAEFLLKFIKSRDLHCAMVANKALEEGMMSLK